MSTDEFSDAPQQNGEFLRPADIMGHLLIVFPIGYIENFPTQNSRPDRPSDAIACDVVDLDLQDPVNGQPGRLFRNQRFLQSQLIMSLRPMVGKRVLGRMNKGVAKPGFNPPWVLDPMSSDPQALERARAWLAGHSDFTPSEFVPWTPRAQAPLQQGYGPQQGYAAQPYQPPAPQPQPQPQFQQPTYPQQQPAYPPPQPQPQQPYPPQQPQYHQPGPQYQGAPAYPAAPPQPQFQPAPPDPWASAAPPPPPPPAATPPMAPVAGSVQLTPDEQAALDHLRDQQESTILERLQRARQLQTQDPAAQAEARQHFGF